MIPGFGGDLGFLAVSIDSWFCRRRGLGEAEQLPDASSVGRTNQSEENSARFQKRIVMPENGVGKRAAVSCFRVRDMRVNEIAPRKKLCSKACFLHCCLNSDCGWLRILFSFCYFHATSGEPSAPRKGSLEATSGEFRVRTSSGFKSMASRAPLAQLRHETDRWRQQKESPE